MALLLAVLAPVRTFAASGEPELHARNGLPRLAALARAASGELRVAYLGGSITAADGWRGLTTENLRKLFPRLTVVEIAAGLPGTGSDLGVCRLETDVLRHRPDLLFVEFAVNDAATPPERIGRTLEGIVRQALHADPGLDLWFVYTFSTPGLPDLQAGRFPPAAEAMETVAAHYGIPSLHLGVEVARRIAAGTFVFRASADAAAPAFSLDGVHPTPAGHRIYAEVVARSLPALLAAAAPRAPALPPPLHVDNWSGASLLFVDRLNRHGDWSPVPADDPNLRGSTQALLPPLRRASAPGAAIEFEFTGRRFGLLGIAAPDSGSFRVTVDDLPPVTDTFFDAYVSPAFCRQRGWFFPQELAAGPHRVRVELLAAGPDKAEIKAAAGKPIADPAPYAANRLTLAGALVVGPARP
jgi:lysophospholipase L1-like esterase